MTPFIAVSLGMLVAVVWASRGLWFRVDEGHVAVVTTFGAAEHEGGQLKVRGPGLHMKLPWQHVITVSVKEQNLDLSGEAGRTAMAADGTVLRLDSNLRYAPVKQELSTFLFGLKRPLEHITGLFTCLLRNEIANFKHEGSADFEGGSFAAIRSQRQRLNTRIAEFCQTEISGQYGVKFAAVDLTDILPPDELAVGLNAVINARSEAEARVFRAESEERQRLLSAEQGVGIAKARAQAIETEMVTLGSFLAELQKKGLLHAYVARRRAEVHAGAKTVFIRDSAEVA